MNGESFASFLLVSVCFANLEANYTPYCKRKRAQLTEGYAFEYGTKAPRTFSSRKSAHV